MLTLARASRAAFSFTTCSSHRGCLSACPGAAIRQRRSRKRPNPRAGAVLSQTKGAGHRLLAPEPGRPTAPAGRAGPASTSCKRRWRELQPGAAERSWRYGECRHPETDRIRTPANCRRTIFLENSLQMNLERDAAVRSKAREGRMTVGARRPARMAIYCRSGMGASDDRAT